MTRISPTPASARARNRDPAACARGALHRRSSKSQSPRAKASRLRAHPHQGDTRSPATAPMLSVQPDQSFRQPAILSIPAAPEPTQSALSPAPPNAHVCPPSGRPRRRPGAEPSTALTEEFRSSSAAPNQKRGQQHDGQREEPQGNLHFSTLNFRHEPAAVGQLFTALVKTAIPPMEIEQTAQLRAFTEEPGDTSYNSTPHAAIQPIRNPRPPGIERDHSYAVKFVDVELAL